MRLCVIGAPYYFVLGGKHHHLSVARCQGVESKKERRWC
jgi:hypothetical protein